MTRINLLLLLAVVGCALGVVTAQHRARQLFQALEREQNEARKLDVEFGQLQLEQSTWAGHARIEQMAREKLHMQTPDSKQATARRNREGR